MYLVGWIIEWLKVRILIFISVAVDKMFSFSVKLALCKETNVLLLKQWTQEIKVVPRYILNPFVQLRLKGNNIVMV